jgi:hypothetical protein
MARWLTPWRAALAAILLGLVFGLGCPVRPARDATWRGRPETRVRWRAQQEFTAAARALRTLTLVDSARRAHPLPDTARLHVIASREVAPAVARVIEGAVRRAWPAGPRPAGAPDGIAVLVLDRNLFRHTVEVVHHLPGVPGARCLTMVRLGTAIGDGANVRSNLALDLRDYLPGLCGLAAAFGPPGTHVARWLTRTGGWFARDVRWTGPSTRVEAPRISMNDVATMLEFSASSGALARCASGRAEACAAYVAATGPDGVVVSRYGAIGGGVTVAVPVPVGQRRYAIDRWEQRFVADLIRAEGPEAFAAFWTSDAPLEEAFAQAFGRSLAAWTADWTDAVGLEAPSAFHSPWRLLPTLLVFALAGLGGAARYTSRRTVSA